MPTIKEGGPFTVLVEFEVDPSHQQELVDAVSDLVRQHFPSYPGFLSATFHASEDGRRVINYAQWESKEAWQRAFEAPGRARVTESILQSVKRCNGKPLQATPVRVARVVEGSAVSDPAR